MTEKYFSIKKLIEIFYETPLHVIKQFKICSTQQQQQQQSNDNDLCWKSFALKEK